MNATSYKVLAQQQRTRFVMRRRVQQFDDRTDDPGPTTLLDLARAMLERAQSSAYEFDAVDAKTLN